MTRLTEMLTISSGNDESIELLKKKYMKLSDDHRVAKEKLERLKRSINNPVKNVALKQISHCMNGIVEALFNPNAIPVSELRAVLHRVFPTITFEGRDGKLISFWSIHFCTGAAVAFQSDTKQLSDDTEIISLRVISPKLRYDPVLIEILSPGKGYRFPGTNEKRCRKCGTVKSVSDFAKSRHASDGLQTYCKQCHKHLKLISRNRSCSLCAGE